MSLETNIIELAEAIGADTKTIYDNQGDLTGLLTNAKNDLVVSMNELYGLVTNANSSDIDDNAIIYKSNDPIIYNTTIASEHPNMVVTSTGEQKRSTRKVNEVDYIKAGDENAPKLAYKKFEGTYQNLRNNKPLHGLDTSKIVNISAIVYADMGGFIVVFPAGRAGHYLNFNVQIQESAIHVTDGNTNNLNSDCIIKILITYEI